jgi:hypothetical protein
MGEMTFIEALRKITEFPGAIPTDDAERLEFAKSLLVEADATWGIKQEVDDAINLPPGLEQMSDMAIQMAYDTYAPMMLASILGKLK